MTRMRRRIAMARFRCGNRRGCSRRMSFPFPISGIWGRTSGRFRTAAIGAGPVMNKTRTFYALTADTIDLKPQAAER